MNLHQYKMLSFDTYGTLIDWESGIANALEPLNAGLARPHHRDGLLEAFAAVELRLQHTYPRMLYSDLLAQAHRDLAQQWGAPANEALAIAFGKSVKHWPAFDDAPATLQYLREHYLMVTITNCDRISYMGSNARLEIEWDGIYTAQDIGSYKPDPRNFPYMLAQVRREFGVLAHEILHVAQSLTHDMVPATTAGLPKVWINRRHAQPGHGATAKPTGEYVIEMQVPSMAALVEAHQAQH